jgi:DNA mismatch endonuclease (patch repair protein)
MDKITTEKRSRNMKNIRSKNTAPELTVRKYIYSLGYRYRIHYKKLPGRPDIVFPSINKVIFVHGCFWHQHKRNCLSQHKPKSNSKYWEEKFEKNIERDKRNLKELKKMGWDVLIIWECESKKIEKLKSKIIKHLNGSF